MSGAQSTPAPGGTVRLGLLGCADVAVRRVLPAVANLTGVRLAAVASRRWEKAAAVSRRFGGEPVEGYAALLRRSDVDAVYLPLPSGLHAEWIERALAAGKHVLAEKPLTTSYERSVELVAAARKAGLVLMENYMFVHHAQHRTVRQMVADGAIGEPRAFAATFTIPPRPAGDIRHRAELGGGALLDVGGYPVRAAQLFLGPDLTVAGAARHVDGTLGVDIAGAALLCRDDGVTAQLTFGMAHTYVSSYQFIGSLGRLTVEHVFTPPASHRPEVRVDRQDRQTRILLPTDDQYAGAVRAFLAAVADSDRPSGFGTAATDQARLIDAIHRAQA